MSERKTQQQSESALVAHFLSGDAERVLKAVWAAVNTRDPEVLKALATALPAIKKATTDLELGGILVANSGNLEHALNKIELFNTGVCLCAAYPLHQGYDPVKEERRQHVQIVDTVPDDRKWVPDRICECRDCGKRYQVEEGDYHYTWWKWTELT